MVMTIKNGEYEKYPEFFPVGSQVRCENEWQPGKWARGTVSAHQLNRYGVPQWIIIELEDGADAEFDYRYLDVEDSRNSLVRKVR